jgi:tetratricopeptide (TPR) repeat protein
MDTRTPEPIGREQRLDEVLADYLKEAAAGRAPRQDVLLKDHPDLAPDLTAFFDDRDRFDRLAAPLRQLTAEAVALPGDIDGYQLIAEIARGGMGVVWKARQIGLNRTVALKMLRAGVLAGPGELRRFQAEAEAVAALDHPRIVPVYEVGENAGQPYLAMKYFEGGNLSDALASFLGDDKKSASLVVEIADAIHHAHLHGVLHRDLKPGNILLDAEGRPHVSDFGLAKRMLSKDTATYTAGLTQTGDLVGTPSYMAPEQARGAQRAVTVATDVYGLGAILYELLTGLPPFRGEGLLDTLKQIQDKPPVSPRRVRPNVHRDLETICLKALEKEPGLRYPGVQAMADDLRRFLAGEPVLARPVGRVTHAWRWCRRRPALAGLALALVVAIVAGFAAVTWQWQRAERHLRQSEINFERAESERERAESERERAEENLRQAEQNFHRAHDAVSEFCVRLSDNRLTNVPGTQPVRRYLLEAALKYYEQFLAEKGDDPRLSTELAAVCRRLGEINAVMGARDRAITAFKRSRKILEEQVPDSPGRKRDLARTILNLALLQTSDGQLDAALLSYEEGEKLLKGATESAPDSIQDTKDFAAMLVNKGLLCSRLGRVDEARECYVKQIEVLSDLSKRHPERPDLGSDLALGYIDQGVLLISIGQSQEGIEAYEKAKALLEPLVRSAPSKERYAEMLVLCLLNLGKNQYARGQREEGQKCIDRARGAAERLASVNPDMLQYSRDLANCWRETGNLQMIAKHPAEAAASYEKARVIMDRIVRRDEKSGELQSDRAKCYFDLGGANERLNKSADAQLNYLQSAEIRKKLVASEPGNLFYRCDLGLTLGNVAACQLKQGQVDQALDNARSAVAQLELAFTGAPQVGMFRRYLIGAYGRHADVSLRAGKITDAVATTRKRRELCTSNGAQLFSCACAFARAATMVQETAAASSSSVQRVADYTQLALETLRQAVKAGFKDVEQMTKNEALAGLKSHPEFEALLAEIGKH